MVAAPGFAGATRHSGEGIGGGLRPPSECPSDVISTLAASAIEALLEHGNPCLQLRHVLLQIGQVALDDLAATLLIRE